jgi:CRISPR associated protein Cas1
LTRSGHSPRNAADPINALLNYGYALAEAEARMAALTVGLDPGLGILHTDQKHRDSLALDLLEALRPVVERHVLTLTSTRTFRASDFEETRDGRCRLRRPLTHDVAEQLLPALARAVAGPAETVAHLLATSSPGKIHLSTPLSRANTTKAQLRGQRTANRREAAAGPTVRATCRKCGVDLYGSARKLCPTCWPVVRADYLRQLGKAGAKPAGPAKPTVEQLSGGWTFELYQTRILPALRPISLPEMERATGLSNATCSRVRRGLQVRNPRHWAALATLAGLGS